MTTTARRDPRNYDVDICNAPYVVFTLSGNQIPFKTHKDAVTFADEWGIPHRKIHATRTAR